MRGNVRLKTGKNNQTVSDSQHIANTRLLTKIITYIGAVGEDSFENIVKNINQNYGYKIRDGLHWMVNHNVVIKFHKQNQDYYKLNKMGGIKK